MEQLIGNYIVFLTKLKLYHWSTTSYARHIASDNLYNNLNKLLDRFVEAYQGKYNRINFNNHNFNINKTIVKDDTTIIISINHLISNLEKELPKFISVSDSDLLNLRDEMLNELRTSLYLFSLN